MSLEFSPVEMDDVFGHFRCGAYALCPRVEYFGGPGGTSNNIGGR